MKLKTFLTLLILFSLSSLGVYYFYPVSKIPGDITIDKVVVYKAQHKLIAYSKGNMIVSYTIAIGKNPIGSKEYEGDLKTPEGKYKIFDKNFNSAYHRNLGISYPNAVDIAKAHELKRRTGSDIKIHGLKNGQGYIGRFHRFKDWTNGCIALTNEEIDELYNHTPIGTEIEIFK